MTVTANRRQILTGTAATVGASMLGAPGLLLAQTQPLKIGVAVPSSGPMSFLGNDFLGGVKLAAAQINKEGGLLGRQIEIVARDDKFSGAGAIAAAREFAGMGINLQIGGGFTPMVLGVLPILDEIKSVFVCIAAQTMSITHELYNRHMFRPWANNYMVGRGLAKSALQNFRGAQRWVAVATDNAFGRDAAKIFMDAIKDFHPRLNGGAQAEILPPVLVSPTQTDFQLQITQMMGAGIDGIYVVVPGAPGVAFHRQSKQLGLDKRYKVVVDVSGDPVAKALSGDLPANFWTYTAWPYQVEPMKSNKASQQAMQEYTAMTGDKYPSSYIGIGARSSRVLFEGVRKAKSTETDAVINAIENNTFDFFGTPFTVRKEDHQGIGVSHYARVVPAKTEAKWTLTDLTSVPESSLIEAASPGRPFAG